MKFDEKLVSKMEERGIRSIRELSERCGIPYTTMKHWEGKSPDVIQFGKIRILSAFFGVSLSYWVSEKEDVFDITAIEKKLIVAYRASSNDTQKAVCNVLGVKKTGMEDCSEMA